MGYLVSGYAFAGAPRWAELERLLAAFRLRGYRQKAGPLFLLDAWAPRGGGKHSPFCAEPVRASMLEGAGPNSASAVVAAFDEIGTLLGDVAAADYGAGWLSVPLSIAAAAGTPTFAFTADDDMFDFAAYVDAGAIVHAGCRLGPFKVIAGEEMLFVVPYAIEEDDYVPDDALLARLAALRNVQVLATEHVDGGFPLHEHPLILWPKNWGDATELLGFGTFDALVRLDEEFEVVHESGPRPRAWWKLWS